MPRGFTETERTAIRARLLAAARDSIEKLGIRRTTVAPLAREAGISKGAFYLFFSTRENLIMEVLLDAEAEARAELESVLQQAWKTPRELVTRFLEFQFEILDRHPILRSLLDPDEMLPLMRALPPETLAARMAEDDLYFTDIFDGWRRRGWIREVDAQALAGLPRLALAMLAQRALIGEERFQSLVALVIESLAANIATSPGSAP